MKKTLSIVLILILAISALCAQAAIEKQTLLSSENWAEDSAVARSINEYITAITDENSDSFIPVKDRIAVFDLDGTIIIEDAPFCFEYMVFEDYALNSGSPTITPEVKAVAQEIIDASWGEKPSGMSTRQATAGAIAYKGMTMAEFSEMVSRFKETDIKGYTGLKWSDCGYRPMVELVNVLKANGFEVYYSDRHRTQHRPCSGLRYAWSGTRPYHRNRIRLYGNQSGLCAGIGIQLSGN